MTQPVSFRCDSNSDSIEETTTEEVYLPHVVLYSFDAETPEELSISKGERLEILQNSTTDEHEWVFARNASSESGLVPAVYVRQIDTDAQTERIASANSSNWNSQKPKQSGDQNGKPHDKLPPPRPPMPNLLTKSSNGRESPNVEILMEPSQSRLTPVTAKRKCSGPLAKEPWYYGRVTR